MKTMHKLCLVLACLVLLAFSGCTQTHDESDAFPVEEITTTAEVLTQQLTCFAFDANDTLGSSGYPIDNDRIYRFIVSTVMFIDNKEYRYHSFITVDEEEGYIHYPKDKVDQISAEVFDVQDCKFGESVGTKYDPTSGDYLIMSGFGIGNGLWCENMSVQIDQVNAEVTVDFDLYKESPFDDGEDEKVGTYKTRFSIFKQPDNTYFLRYIETIE